MPPKNVEVPETVERIFPPVMVSPLAVESPPDLSADNPPENVEVAEVEVALIEETVSLPAMAASPWTPREVPGVEVAIPTNPFPLTTNSGELVPWSPTTNTFS